MNSTPKVATVMDQRIGNTPFYFPKVSTPENQDEIVTFTNAFFRGPSWRASSRKRLPRTIDVAVDVGASSMAFEGGEMGRTRTLRWARYTYLQGDYSSHFWLPSVATSNRTVNIPNRLRRYGWPTYGKFELDHVLYPLISDFSSLIT